MKFYADIKAIMRLAIKDDDRMDQGTLFDLQDAVSALALRIAIAEGKENDLVRTFPAWFTEKEA